MVREGKISPDDVDLLLVTDDLDEAVEHMKQGRH
jgi:predicted Rossmann-fold nucleotide-binding protein